MYRTLIVENGFAIADAVQERSNMIEHNGVVLNLSNTTLNYEDKKIDLTKHDLKILRILFESVGKVVSMDKIIGYLWEEEEFVDRSRISVNVINLKKKLGKIGLNDYIEANSDTGYVIN